MAKKNKEINIEDVMDMLIGQLSSMDRKGFNEWLKTETEALGLDMKSKYHKTKMSTARKKYTEENYPHFQPAKKVRKFTLRITLKGIRPAIWRKVEVPSNITLRHLSELILPLMGWTGYHLNQFRKGDDLFTPAYQSEDNDVDRFYGIRQHASEEFIIADILREKGKTVLFEYDFGDDWQHDIRLSSVADYKPDEPHRIRFVGGKRACPPEDCGGVWGYEELCEEQTSMEGMSSEYKEMCQMGLLNPRKEDPNCFDPEAFDEERAAEICERFND